MQDLTPKTESGPKTMSELTAIRIGEPRGFELESAGAVYRYRKRQFGLGIHDERQRQIPTVVDEFLWSLGD